LCC
ncbi:methylmalonate-semialdehyde dehydrogenase, partial [Vibrio parahaemolyticus V-223/04]|jgi:hypothetical protein